MRYWAHWGALHWKQQDTGGRSLQAYIGFVQEHPASQLKSDVTAVEFPSATDDMSCHIQHPLELVSGGHCQPGQHSVTIFNMRCDEGVYNVFCIGLQINRS